MMFGAAMTSKPAAVMTSTTSTCSRYTWKLYLPMLASDGWRRIRATPPGAAGLPTVVASSLAYEEACGVQVQQGSQHNRVRGAPECKQRCDRMLQQGFPAGLLVAAHHRQQHYKARYRQHGGVRKQPHPRFARPACHPRASFRPFRRSAALGGSLERCDLARRRRVGDSTQRERSGGHAQHEIAQLRRREIVRPRGPVFQEGIA